MTRSGSLLCCLTLLHFVGNCNGAFAAEPRLAKVRIPENPFAYCSRVATADSPAGGSSPVPPALAPYLARALGLHADVEFTAESYYWRCMDGAVYVCAIGANLPCDAKAERAKRNEGAENYCREYREAAFVPAYATGHDTIYEWTCSNGRAVRGKRTATLDRRGYRIEIWHKVLRDSEPYAFVVFRAPHRFIDPGRLPYVLNSRNSGLYLALDPATTPSGRTTP